MAGPAPSNENPGRRSLRLAVGVASTFVIGQLIGWPLAYVAPVFAAVLLLEAAPLSVRQGLGIFGTAVVAIAGGFLTALFLLPYPPVLVLVSCLVLFWMFLNAFMSGVPLLAFVGMLLGFVIVPVAVRLLPEVAFIAGYGLLVNFAVAILAVWVAFLVIPPSKASSVLDPDKLSYADAVSLAATLTIVVAPLLIGFLAFGWTKILVLVYAVIFAAGMSREASSELGGKSMIANLIYGGVGMLLAFELLVIAPSLVFMIVLVFAMCAFYGSRIFSGSPMASTWSSGFMGFLILLGGALLADDVVAAETLFKRVAQIFMATAYIVFAYRVVDLIKSALPKQRATARA
jgi:hypothetical protein